MKRRTKLACAAAIAATAIVAMGLRPTAQRGASANAPTPSAQSAAARFAFDWPAGTQYEYALAWRDEETRAIEANGSPLIGLAGKLELDGRLVLRSYGVVDHDYVLAASVEDVTRASFAVQGEDALADAATRASTLDGRVAWVSIGSDGRVTDVRFAKDAPEVFRHLMTELFSELQTVVPAGASAADGAQWTTLQPVEIGHARVSYRVAARSPDRIAIDRTRLDVAPDEGVPRGAKVDLTGAAQVELAPRGHVVRFSASEGAHARAANGAHPLDVESVLALTLERLARFDASTPPALAELDVARIGEHARPASVDADLLEQRVAGLTPEQMQRDLAAATSGRLPDHARYLWRATGLLLARPETARDLVAVFRASATTAQRALVLDLLASAGNAEAQAAMREALASRAALGDAAYPLLVQRFSVVRAPDRASADFVRARFEDATRRGERDARYGAAYALGAMASKLARGDERDRAAADAIAGELRTSAERAKRPAERAPLIVALGAAARADDVAYVTSFAHDDAPELRRATAQALAKTDGDDVRATLVGLMGDADTSVQAAALAPLAKKALDDDDWRAIESRVTGGGVRRALDSDLATFLGEHLDRGAQVRRMLEALLAREADDAQVAARLRALLARCVG